MENLPTETLQFTQAEIQIILSVFNSCTIKLGDAILMLPIVEKLKVVYKPAPEKPVEGEIIPEGQVDHKTN